MMMFGIAKKPSSFRPSFFLNRRKDSTFFVHFSKNQLFWSRLFSSIISKENLSTTLQSKKKFTLIDVREPHELEITGKIGNAINIPLSTLNEKLGGLKLDKKEELIFYCRSGGRAENACKIAESQGFSNVKNYKGSALDWFPELDPNRYKGASTTVEEYFGKKKPT